MMQTDKEYAEALFALSLEEGLETDISGALTVLKQVIDDNPEYIGLLSSPAIPMKERMALIDEALEGSVEYVISFVKLICEKGHAQILPMAVDEYFKLVDAFSGKAKATVYSAIELDDKQKKAVCLKLEKLTGKQPEPVYVIDKSLIGGLKIETEGKVYDGSIRHRLLDVKDVIIG